MTDFKRRRPGALEIPTTKVQNSRNLNDPVTPSQQLVEMMSNFDCNYDPPPMSAPGGLCNKDFESSLRDIIQSGGDKQMVRESSDEFHVGPRIFNMQQARASLNHAQVPMSARETSTRCDQSIKLETEVSGGPRYSLPNSPSEARKTSSESKKNALGDLPSSCITSPLSSPRVGSENYKEMAAIRRQRRSLYRAMKTKRTSSLAGNNLEALSMMIAEKDRMQDEVVDKKISAAVKNRENAARARQTTKENMQRLRDQNESLQKEVHDLKHENQNLKEQMEKLSQMLRQVQFPMDGFSSHESMRDDPFSFASGNNAKMATTYFHSGH